MFCREHCRGATRHACRPHTLAQVYLRWSLRGREGRRSRAPCRLQVLPRPGATGSSPVPPRAEGVWGFLCTPSPWSALRVLPLRAPELPHPTALTPVLKHTALQVMF